MKTKVKHKGNLLIYKDNSSDYNDWDAVDFWEQCLKLYKKISYVNAVNLTIENPFFGDTSFRFTVENGVELVVPKIIAESRQQDTNIEVPEEEGC